MRCPDCGSFLHHSFITEMTQRSIYQCSWSRHQEDDRFWWMDGGMLRRVRAVKVGGGWEVELLTLATRGV